MFSNMPTFNFKFWHNNIFKESSFLHINLSRSELLKGIYYKNIINQIKSFNLVKLNIPMMISWKAYDKNYHHMVLLIYTKEDDKFYIVDSHRKHMLSKENYEKVNKIYVSLFNNFEIITTGLQNIEHYSRKKEDLLNKGYCLAWTYFFAYCCIHHTNLEVKEIIEIIYETL